MAQGKTIPDNPNNLPVGAALMQSSLAFLWTELREKWEFPYREKKKKAVNKEHLHKTQKGLEIKSLAALLSD